MANNQAQKKFDEQNRGYYDVRNARTVTKATNDNYPRESSFVPERRTVQPQADNDNNKESALRKVAVEYSKSYQRGRSSVRTKTFQMPTRTIPANVNVLKKASAVPALISAGTTPYMFQLAFALIGLVGYVSMGTVDSSNVLSAIDTVGFGTITDMASALWIIGTLGALISGAIIAALATIPLKRAGGHPAGGGSIFVLAGCVTAHLCPILNLFPIMALWCVFVLRGK